MSLRGGFEEFQGEAAALEKKYEWLGAADVYDRALGTVDEGDFFRGGKVKERIGYCFQRAAFQAESREEFLERLGKAVEAYEVARGHYERVAEKLGAGWALRCGAVTRYLEHWIASDPPEKRRLLRESLKLEEKALVAFWEQGAKLEYGKTFNMLSYVPWLIANSEWDRQTRRDALEHGVSWGEKAIEVLSELGDPYEIAQAHRVYAMNFADYSYYFEPEPDRRIQNWNKAVEHAKKAVEISEKIGDIYTAGLSHIMLGNFEKALECGEKTQDVFLKAYALLYLSTNIYWDGYSTDDPEKRIKLAEEAMGFYDRAQHYSELMSFQIPLRGKLGAPSPGGYAEYYWDRARWEFDLKKKFWFLEESEKAGSKALKAAQLLDIPNPVNRMYHILSGTLATRASLEQDIGTKRGLLEKALEYREKNIEIISELAPFHYWNIGFYQYLLANIKAELALIQTSIDSKKMLLEDAITYMEKSLESSKKEMPFSDRRYASVSRYQDDFGETLKHLYDVTKKPEYLRRAIRVWQETIDSASRLDLISRIAESNWKIAKAYDTLGEYSEAANYFKNASESYMKAAEKISQLMNFYKEHASYMQAWSEIEKARHRHTEKRYGAAKEHYEKAAEHHRSTERWSHLAPNYHAWARLDEAEDLSRREETEEARDLFQRATGLFKEAKGSIEIKLRTIQDEEERKLLVNLVRASGIRCEYCLGRTALEEARILDRQGDHLASAREYGQATERFQKVIDTMEFESDRKELRPIVYLCQAWEKMMLAEARTSPEFYNEAAELFEQARKHALDQSTSLLAQAHSSFCKALEAGTRFERDRDSILFSTAKNHIEAATSQYLRAGYKTMSDYVGATSRLLDAYQYSYNAQTEVDTKKKAQFYQIAERLLQSSAGAYLKAKHPEKSEEVRRILERVKEEREIAVSLSEVLHAPTIVSTTTSFSTPTPTQEQAVGLERFENADIQANLILGGREVKVGDDVDIEIELVNAGKAPAQLIKVEEIIPDGFEVRSAPDICRVEDSYLDMKGRTLNPLKTAELKIVLRPLDKGTYNLKPRVLYLDEAGKYRSHEPEPATVVVKELGIKGWLRGPTR